MNNRKSAHTLKALMCAALLLVMIVSALGALAEAEPAPPVTEAEYLAMKERLEALEAERALDIALYRSDLENLHLLEGPIYVAGHKSPDSDTVCSAICYATLLKSLGYDARPCVLGSISSETKYILDRAGADVPELLEDASGCNIVLVDHSEFVQSAKGLENANIIGIIDHHGDGSVTTGHAIIYDAKPLGSTATIVWMRYRQYGVETDPRTAALLVGAILSDTNNLKNSTTTADREALARLAKIAGIEDTQAFYTEIYQHSIAYDGMSDEEIFESDVKDYQGGGTRFTIAVVNAYDEDVARDMSRRMRAIMPKMVADHGADMAFAQISIYHDDISITYLVPSNEAAAEALREAFGEKLSFDGTAYILKPGVSRKRVLVPALTEVLENHPQE